MQNLDTPQRLSLTGEVVETFERDGADSAKIFLRPIHIEVPTRMLDGVHLGDTIHLDATLTIQKIETNIRFENPYLDPDIEIYP